MDGYWIAVLSTAGITLRFATGGLGLASLFCWLLYNDSLASIDGPNTTMFKAAYIGALLAFLCLAASSFMPTYDALNEAKSIECGESCSG